MIFADDLTAEFSIDVKTYQRLEKGKLITVHEHNRTGNASQQEENNDKSLVQSIKTGQNVPFNVAVAGLGLVGIAAGTKAFVVARHAGQVTKEAERVLTTPALTDLRVLSKQNPVSIPSDLNKYEGVIIATGGFAGTKGQHTLDLHKYLEKHYPNHLVLSVENIHNDLGWEEDAIKRFSKVPSLLWKNATQGNKTSEELALLTKTVRQKTDKPITFVTASGGGMAVKEAQEITDKLGYKNIEGFGLGSPTWDLSNPKSKYVSIMDSKDAGTGWLPFRSKKDAVVVDRGTEKITLKRNPYQGNTEWQKQHEYDAYLSHPEVRSIADNIIYRHRKDKQIFHPSNYYVDKVENTAYNKYLQNNQQYSKLEQQAWVNFNTLFPSMVAEFSGEQQVKVKSYIRDGKLVHAYSAKRDKAVEDPNIIERLRNNISNKVEDRGVEHNTAEKIAIVATVGAVTGVSLVAGKYILEGGLNAALASARIAWNNNFLKRNRLIEEMADDLVAGRKLFRGKTLRETIGNADTVITIKGGINMGGKGGTLIKDNYLEKLKKPSDKWVILDLDNLELDSKGLKNGKLDIQQTLNDFWSNFVINPFTKGYNKDSIEIAAYMRATEKIKPNTNKVMMGYSAGAVGTVAAASDLSKMRNVSKLKAITFGAPYSGVTKIEDNRIVDTVSFINKDDILANSALSRGQKEDINAIIQERPNKRADDDILAGHGWKSYFDSRYWDKIRRIINNGSQEAFK